MKLYTKPGACSLADHIALQWTGQPFDLQVVTQQDIKSPEYLAKNPEGKVPMVEDGSFILTQNAAIMGYIADSYPQTGLAGDGSPQQRAEATRWLSFCNADLHPQFGALFHAPAGLDEQAKATLQEEAKRNIRRMFETADRQLAGREWLAGFRSFADPYLFVITLWARKMKIELSDLANLQAFIQRMQADSGVVAAMKAEGLIA